MNYEEFDVIVEERLEKIREILGKKAEEYARGDRLSNFKRAAAAERCTPERALIGMWMKHVISILDMVDDLEMEIVAPAEMWDEKIGDAINYLVLLEGLVRERLTTILSMLTTSKKPARKR